jgi:ankyrin repeat protein
VISYSFAAKEQNLQMVKFLLSRGASPNEPNGYGSPLEKAASSSTIPIVAALLDAGGKLKGSAALSKAAGSSRIDVLIFLLDRGADINQLPELTVWTESDWDQVKNPLCEAAWHGNDDVVRFLLERGADVSVKDGKGTTALEIAQMQSHESCVTLLTSGVGSEPGV